MRVFRRFLREVSTSSKRLPGVFQENTSASSTNSLCHSIAPSTYRNPTTTQMAQLES